jgi:hypothetical protein
VEPFGEVIESSLQTFLGQCWQWNNVPSFGSLVVINNKRHIIFGLVHQIQTGSMDPVRYPFPYKKTHEELMAEQPQIFEFLKTTFSCITLGYMHNNSIAYITAPEPPLIHSFITPLSAAQYKQYFATHAYLQLLFNMSNHISCLDELLLALLQQQAQIKLLDSNRLDDFIHTYSLLIGNDYRRLKLFLLRVQNVLP